MKGILLAGGIGSRLAPLTQEDNKHYLPVYKKRMIEYPLQTLVEAGIQDIIIVTGGKRPGNFLELLKDGRSRGINNLCFTYQEGSGGIADALGCAESFIKTGEECTVVLGDNYFEDPINLSTKVYGADIFLRQTETPWYFGIAEVTENRVISIEEKPSNPKSDLAILGIYQFDYTLWDKLKRIEPSARGELEITDVLKLYMNEDNLSYSIYEGYWSDMGAFESWTEVSQRVANRENS